MRRFVIQIAAIFWLFAGVMLLRAGINHLRIAYDAEPEAWWKVAVAVVFGIFLGLVKGRDVLAKSALRNKRRISKLPAPVRPWQFYTPTFFCVLAFMIGLGQLLKLLASTGHTARLIVGGVDCGIGGALFLSAFAYWFSKAFAPPNPWVKEPAPVKTGKIGVILANLGTPTAPTPRAVARFLREFLSDPRVIEVPKVIWVVILNLFIVPYRRFTSASLYKRVFTEEGSPLLVIGRRQVKDLQSRLGEDITVRLGMRYGNPSIAGAMADLKSLGCDRVLVVPAYPQYSGTTSASIYDAGYQAASRYRMVPALRFAAPYPTDPGYIKALAETYKKAIKDFDCEHLLFSYHSIPITYAERGDPYATQCVQTTKAVVQALGLHRGEWSHCYQSVFGLDPWLGPQTDSVLKKLADKGVKRVAVICPGFLVDCLETIDEIGEVSRDLFLAEGGEELKLIPCLNDDPTWVAALADIIENECLGWRTPAAIEAGQETNSSEALEVSEQPANPIREVVCQE
ncbi:MAG: ferrochelatase [Planctomycetota bacterium]|nr:ferrochelatase [Planctomycetota bacterium]